jgi:hypothetical protein
MCNHTDNKGLHTCIQLNLELPKESHLDILTSPLMKFQIMVQFNVFNDLSFRKFEKSINEGLDIGTLQYF